MQVCLCDSQWFLPFYQWASSSGTPGPQTCRGCHRGGGSVCLCPCSSPEEIDKWWRRSGSRWGEDRRKWKEKEGWGRRKLFILHFLQPLIKEHAPTLISSIQTERKHFFHKVNLFVSFSLSITVPGTNGKIKSVAHLPLDKSICYFQCWHITQRKNQMERYQSKKTRKCQGKEKQVQRWAGTFSFTRTCKSLGTTGENTCYLLKIKHYSHLFKDKWMFRMLLFFYYTLEILILQTLSKQWSHAFYSDKKKYSNKVVF